LSPGLINEPYLP